MSFQIDNLRFRYPAADKDALAGITARIERGETTAIVGLSGWGKSTLLSVLGLLIGTNKLARREMSGSVKFEDPLAGSLDLLTQDERQREIWRLTKYGFVLQSAYLLPHFNGIGNILIPLALLGIDATNRLRILKEKLAVFDDSESRLHDKLRQPAWTLSGGERQRAAVLRAVIHDPEVVFADEPTSNLDIVNRGAVLSLLENWKNADTRRLRTLILVTHDVNLALRADQLLILCGGQLVGGRTWRVSDLGDCLEEREARLEHLIQFGDPGGATCL